MKIGDRIKQRRLELGLSVDDLAAKLGKNRATVYRYESHDIENFPTTILEPLAQALETTPAYLMGWEQIDHCFSGKEASDDIYRKFSQKQKQHDEHQKRLLEIYGKLSPENKNKTLQYSKNLLSIQSLDAELVAAHERTDIEIDNDMIKHDDDIMDDENF